ncbi:MAG: NUDIX domain-containing protein, partial [Planctomycetota bacterium]
MNSPPIKPRTRRKRGVVGVIFRNSRLLVIRRALRVTAPGKLCLPGGAIEQGETEEQALVREMQEELGIDVIPRLLCFRSVTSWGTNLA